MMLAIYMSFLGIEACSWEWAIGCYPAKWAVMMNEVCSVSN